MPLTLSVSTYRKLAEDCLDMAERATPEMKTKLHEMAEVWLQLASEQLEKATGQDPTTDNSSPTAP
jgi:hypothetical protein